MPIFAGALAAGADYLDMAMSLSAPAPRRALREGRRQARRRAVRGRAGEWEAAGRLALVGIGVEPGLSDVFARYAADELFVQIDELGTRDGANLVVRDDDGDEIFAPELLHLDDHRGVPQPAGGLGAEAEATSRLVHHRRRSASPRCSTSPRASARSSACNVEHEEVLLMPRWVDAGRVTFKYGLGEEFIGVLRTLHTLGLDRTEPVSVERGPGVAPRRGGRVLPDPATIGPRMEGKTCAGLWVTGTGKDGAAPARSYLYHVVDNEWSMREYGAQCVVWQTAINPVVALELLAAGAWSGTGVLGPEALPPSRSWTC